MRLASIVSHNPVFKNAAREVVTEAQSFLKGKQPDVAFLFVSAHHSPCYYFVPKEIQEPLKPKGFDRLFGGEHNREFNRI